MRAVDKLCILGLDSPELDRKGPESGARTLRNLLIQHSEFTRAVREIASLHQRWLDCGIAGALLIVGQSGCGKSTLLEYYLTCFPRQRIATKARIPVLRVPTPEAPTVKSFSEAVLVALGDIAASRGSAAVKTQRIIHFIRECDVDLILVDEFHHFCDSNAQERRRVTDWLKNLLNECNKPIVLFGLPRAISALYANEQLRRRFAAPFYFREFGFKTEDEQALFRGVLHHFQGLTKLPWAVDLSSPDAAMRFHFATNGLIDYMVKILDDLVARFSCSETQGLDYPDLQTSFKLQIWADVPDALNPFNPKEAPRRLNKTNEPFAIWDDPKTYTMSKRAMAMGGLK